MKMTEKELFKMFGKLVDSEEVNAFFEKYSSFKLDRPESGRQYAISKELGIDLLFEPDDGMQGGKTKHLRKCQNIFLYSQDKDGHQQYNGFIPFSFEFRDTRKQLLEKEKPERTWKVGEGEVEQSHHNPSHDRWIYNNRYVSANYSKKTSEIMYFIISKINA